MSNYTNTLIKKREGNMSVEKPLQHKLDFDKPVVDIQEVESEITERAEKEILSNIIRESSMDMFPDRFS